MSEASPEASIHGFLAAQRERMEEFLATSSIRLTLLDLLANNRYQMRRTPNSSNKASQEIKRIYEYVFVHVANSNTGRRRELCRVFEQSLHSPVQARISLSGRGSKNVSSNVI